MSGLTERQLRRIQNGRNEIKPIYRPGSTRIADFPDEELARFFAAQFAKNRSFNRQAAARLGILGLLDRVERDVDADMAAADPKRFREIFHLLNLELALFGADSPLAKKMGLSAAEIQRQTTAAKSLLQDLFAAMPNCAATMAGQMQSGLVALGIRRGRHQATQSHTKTTFHDCHRRPRSPLTVASKKRERVQKDPLSKGHHAYRE